MLLRFLLLTAASRSSLARPKDGGDVCQGTRVIASANALRRHTFLVRICRSSTELQERRRRRLHPSLDRYHVSETESKNDRFPSALVGRPNRRQGDDEPGAAFGPILGGYIATHALDDVVADRQAETC